jgi:hypothetical protein
MPIEAKPYIVSSDVEGLFASWSQKTGYVKPSCDFFNGVRNDLENVLSGYFPGRVEVVHEDELKSG